MGTKTMAESEIKKPFSYARGIDNLPPPLQFTALAVGVFFFFGIHNLLQEAIMNVPGFTYGVMLGYMEVLGVAVCSFGERRYIAKEHGRIAPLSAYPLLTMCLLASSALSNMSLNYINFPTKVVFRSCKLIPTMVIASFLHKKIFSILEYTCALAICTGLVLFAAADWELRPSFNPIGLGLVSMSVVADSILPNAQERLFRSGSSRLEVTLYTNTFTLIVMTCTTMLSGDLLGALQQTMQNKQLAIYFTIYTFVAYAAISVHMNVVKRFGGVVAVLLATGRKGMTLILSFVLFPKGFSWFYPAGAVLVLGGLLISSLVKMRSKDKDKNKEHASPTAHHQLKQHGSDVELAEESKK
jgi:adenosine 3'-phospho 5'-phosphosulfate transporter B3